MFDFVVAWGVSRQEEHSKSCVLKQFSDALGGMERCVIDDHHIALREFRYKRLLQPFEKEVAIAISREDDGSEQRIAFESRHEIDAFAGGSVPLFLCFTPLPFGCPAIRVDLITIHACFIDPDTLFFRDQR